MFEVLLMLFYNCYYSKFDVILIGLFVIYVKWLFLINGIDNIVNCIQYEDFKLKYI